MLSSGSWCRASQGITPDRILLTGPGKSEAFLRRALEAGVKTFVAESPGQLAQLQALAGEKRPRVLLRLQLDWEGGESSVLGGSARTPFGMDRESWGELDYPGLHLCGVHVFQWGNIQEPGRLGEIWERIALEARDFAAKNGFPLEVLDLGGGLGIPYDRAGQSLAWESLRPHLELAKTLSDAGELWLELGRFAVGPFGTYITKILDAKTVHGERFLVCEGGSQHLLRPALVGESFPAASLSPPNGPVVSTNVHGPLCTSLDRLGTYALPSDLKAGDLLSFGQCGAYGFTESMPYFLCHELPGEIARKNNRWEVLRPVAAPESWLR
jgi:diaminopimelate decarboxylase